MRRKKLLGIVDELCASKSYKKVFHRSNHDEPMPSIVKLEGAIDLLKQVLFPGYYGAEDIRPDTMPYYIGATLDKLSVILTEQIKLGFCFSCDEKAESRCKDCNIRAQKIADNFLSKLAGIRHMLSTDVTAAYEGDPAAKNPGETIFCYPSITALTHYRIAHELYRLDVPIIPRIITELAHSATGIDIHPGAKIGEKFFMDHGTGIVIGETTIIGKNVRVYQGVTLGAKSFPKDKNGRLIKGIARHPVVKDNVIIYSGATILGRVTIGKKSLIGGNVWLTESVPANTKILQENAVEK